MACFIVEAPGLGRVFLRVRGRRRAPVRCHVEGCTQPAIWECDGHRTPCDPDTGKPTRCDRLLCRKHGRQIAEEIHLCDGCAFVAAQVWKEIKGRILNVGEHSLALEVPQEGERWPEDQRRPHLLMQRRPRRVWLIDGGEAWWCPISADMQWELDKLPGVIDLA